MSQHGRKLIAPVAVTILIILYYIIYFSFLISFSEGFLKYIFGVIPLVFTVITVKVCIERIKEIKKGEEDDLGKY